MDLAVLERFLDKIRIVDTGYVTACWLWTGAIGNHGYGVLNVDGQAALIHRLSHEHWNGTILPSLHLDHLCRIQPCGNPDHTEQVSPRVNQSRGDVNQHKNKTHCSRGHSLAGENLRIQPATAHGARRRICIACERIRRQIQHHRKILQ